MAHDLLFALSNRLNETMPFLNDYEKDFYVLAYNQLLAMRNTIDQPNNEFFDLYFKDKTHKEVMKWIEDESEKW